jgi:hypothetical protein
MFDPGVPLCCPAPPPAAPPPVLGIGIPTAGMPAPGIPTVTFGPDDPPLVPDALPRPLLCAPPVPAVPDCPPALPPDWPALPPDWPELLPPALDPPPLSDPESLPD